MSLILTTLISLITLISLFLPPTAFAAFTFSPDKTSIADTEELTVAVTLDLSSSTANNTYYLRGAFYKEGTIKYFGYTINNNGDAYNGPFSNCQQLFAVTVDASGDWSGSVKAKVDPEHSYFEGSGNYLFRVGRYTESCNLTWADGESVAIQVTQTVIPSPTPSPSPTQSSTVSTSTSSKSPSPTPKRSPSPSPSSKSQQTEVISAEILGQKAEASGQAVTASPKLESPTPTPQAQSSNRTKIASYLAGSGLIVIGLSIGLFLWYHKGLKKKDTDES